MFCIHLVIYIYIVLEFYCITPYYVMNPLPECSISDQYDMENIKSKTKRLIELSGEVSNFGGDWKMATIRLEAS